jgi:hypothetical protein
LGQTLEIHQMSVGPADAGLIIVRDTTELGKRIRNHIPAIAYPPPNERYKLYKLAMDNDIDLSGTVLNVILIDAAEASAKYATKIDAYLKSIGAGKDIDYYILSHFDKDHYGGFKDLIGKYKYKLKTKAYHPDNVNTNYPKPSKTCNTSFFNKISSGKRGIAKVNDTEIDIATINGVQVKLTCVVADCYTLGQDPSVSADSHCPYSNDYNDHSLGWLLQYGSFRFYTGGDLNGLFPKNPIETPMVDSLRKQDNALFTKFDNTAIPKGHVCGIKINHHGSDNSTNAYFLSTLSPKTAFVSCGYHQGHEHPRAGVITDLEQSPWNISDWIGTKVDNSHLVNNTLEKYYVTALLKSFTDIRKDIGKPTSKGIIGGDLVLLIDDSNISTESKFAVHYNGKISTVLEKNRGKDPNNKDVGDINFYQCHKSAAVQPYIKNK